MAIAIKVGPRAFDNNRDRIYAIAAKAHARGRRGSYDLVAADV